MLSSLILTSIVAFGMVVPLSSTQSGKVSSNGATVTITLEVPHIYDGTDVTDFSFSVETSTNFNARVYAGVYTEDNIVTPKQLTEYSYGSGSSASIRTSPYTNSFTYKNWDFSMICRNSDNCYLYIVFRSASNDTNIFEAKSLPFGGTSRRPSYTVSDNNRTLEVSGGSLSFTPEEYDFSDSKLTISEEGSTIDETFTFSYDSWYTDGFEPEDLYLEVVDPEDVFPYMSKDANDTFKIPYARTSVLKDTKVTLAPDLSSGYYVNPNTLEMSDTPRSGFISSGDTFYFPSFKKNDEIRTCTFTLKMENCLGNSADISVPLEYNSNKTYFGTCSTSDYCIVGGRN